MVVGHAVYSTTPYACTTLLKVINIRECAETYSKAESDVSINLDCIPQCEENLITISQSRPSSPSSRRNAIAFA
jgi:hypothetical protein